MDFNSLSPEAQKIVRDKVGKLSPEAQVIVNKKLGISSTEELTKPSLLSKITRFTGESLGLPFRGFKGLGVGIEQSALGKSPYESLQAASRATQPGYEPKEGEKLGSFIGGVAPLAPLGLGGSAIGAGLGAASETAATGKNAGEALLTGGVVASGTLLGGKLLEAGVTGVGLAGKALKAGLRSRLATVKGVSRNIVDKVLSSVDEMTPESKEAIEPFFKAVDQAKEAVKSKLSSLQTKQIGGATPEDVLNAGISLAQKLRTQSLRKVEKASTFLTNTPKFTKKDLLDPIINLLNTIKVRGEVFGSAGSKAETALNRWAKDIEEITREKTGLQVLLGGGSKKRVSELELKQLIRRIDDDTVWEGIADEPIKKVLRGLRVSYDSLLKQNTKYAKSIKPVSKLINTAESLEDALGLSLERGVNLVKTDSSLNKVMGIIGGKKAVSEETLTKTGFSSLLSSAKQRISDIKTTKDAVKILGKELKTPIPQESHILQLAEAAARSGNKSPQYYRLEEILQKTMGKEQGTSLANKLVTSGARDIFLRKQSGTLSNSVFDTLLAFLGEVPVAKLKTVDNVLSKVSRTSFSPGGVTGGIFGNLISSLKKNNK